MLPGALGVDKRIEPKVKLRCRHLSVPSQRSYSIGGAQATPCQRTGFLLDCREAAGTAGRRRPMVPFFVEIKCQLGKSYDVANRIADAEIASEIYSTAGDYDLLVKFYVEDDVDIGHFINEKVQTIPGIQDTRTILTFKAFGK